VRLPTYIEVETSRFCNRTCDWCPNKLDSARQGQGLMEWSTLESILRSLSAHEYNGWLAFHNYNEPLANPRLPCEVRRVRQLLPQAKPTIYTNGDHLTRSLFDELVVAGIVEMRVTVYPGNRERLPSHARLWEWLRQHPFVDLSGWTEGSVRQGSSLVRTAPIPVVLISPDVDRYYDRGGTLATWSASRRTEPCTLTSRSMSIDHLGDVKMCCNVVSGHPAHGQYVLGNVLAIDPIELWGSEPFSRIRARHLCADWVSTPICVTCRQQLP